MSNIYCMDIVIGSPYKAIVMPIKHKGKTFDSSILETPFGKNNEWSGIACIVLQAISRG